MTSPYLRLAEVSSAVHALAGAGARVRVCGTSVRGRTVLAVEAGPPRATSLSVVMAGLHALEWIGVLCALEVARSLAARPPEDRRVLVFPVVNVDGYARVEADLARGARRFRRGNAHGVDLNRNFPTFHGAPTLSGLVPRVFRSGAPLSEPETRAVTSVLDEAMAVGGHDLRAVSLHSFGAKVLFPYGGIWRRAPEHAELSRAAARLAERIGGYHARQSARWVPGFLAPGMEIDHLYEAYGARSLLVECSRGGLSWKDPRTWVSPFRWFNPRDPGAVVRSVAPAVEEFLRG